MIINILFKNDMITIDPRLGQIRYLEDFKNHGQIIFIDIGVTAAECYEYLFKEDRKGFFSSLREDVYNYSGKKIIIKRCEVLQ